MDKGLLLVDLQKAIAQLEYALAMESDNDVMKAGCIQYFEFCFELAWKTVKAYANDQGMSDCNSPRSALKVAFKMEWITDEEVWLDMLSSRNKMSHTYNAFTALLIYEKLPVYYDAINQMAKKLTDLDL